MISSVYPALYHITMLSKPMLLNHMIYPSKSNKKSTYFWIACFSMYLNCLSNDSHVSDDVMV